MRTFRYTLLPFLCLLLLRSSADAQPGAFNPSLLGCGRHGEAEIVCGTVAPEDFERTTDDRFLIVAKMGRGEVKGLDFHVEYKSLPGLDHGGIIGGAMPDVFKFFSEHTKQGSK